MQKEIQQHESYYFSASGFQYMNAIVLRQLLYFYAVKRFFRKEYVKVAKTSAGFILKTRDTSKK